MSDTPPNTRPYRQAHEPGDELTIVVAGQSILWRQIGWHGASGAFYTLDENPGQYERGSFRPLWILADTDPVVTDDDEGLDR